jgi:RHS repeat-associated protein
MAYVLRVKYFGDQLFGFNYNDIDYYYIRNIQGDITSIITKDGTEVARYTYDAWGNHVVSNLTGDNIGDINPFRYRGYYYDKETQLYYLNARYYDPEVGRFISQHDARKIKEIYPHLMKIMYDKKNQTTND